MTPFIPSTAPASNPTVSNDGWYPDLDITKFKASTGLGDVFGPSRVVAAVQAAMIEVNAGIAEWRATQTAAALDAVPAPRYGDVSEKVVLYRAAVFAHARASLLRTTRDYDSTKDGHARADALENTSEEYMRQSAEAIARLTGRNRMIVELIADRCYAGDTSMVAAILEANPGLASLGAALPHGTLVMLPPARPVVSTPINLWD